MTTDEMNQKAQTMFLRDKGRKDVFDFFIANGISNEQAETMTTAAYLAVKDQREEVLQDLQDGDRMKGMRQGIVGGALFVGGILGAIFGEGLAVWYGAILGGLFTMIMGFSKRN